MAKMKSKREGCKGEFKREKIETDPNKGCIARQKSSPNFTIALRVKHNGGGSRTYTGTRGPILASGAKLVPPILLVRS
jgi:hypothetical protein